MTVTDKQLQQLILENYGFSVTSKKLAGYEEQNFLLRSDTGAKYILKISPDTIPLNLLQAQISMVKHLASKELQNCFPLIVPALSGEDVIMVNLQEQSCYVRLQTYLEGTFWVEQDSPDEQMSVSLGSFLGKMDRALQDFSHPALNRYLTWDISTAADALAKVDYIKDAEKRRIAGYFLLQFETEVRPVLSTLRKAYIHNDANDYNVLIEQGRVSGLIDFGDAVYSALINNVAVACTYAMLHSANPLETACAVVQGYHTQMPLTEQELSVLYYLIAARLCISVSESAYNRSQNSENEHHFLTEKAAWELFYFLIELNPVRAEYSFRKSCGFASRIPAEDDTEKLLEARKKVIGKNLSVSYDKPIKIIKGALQYLYDDQGNTYIDCVNNVSHVGHCHPRVVRAAQKQLATLNTNTRYLHDELVAYAQELAAMLPDHLSVCYFTNSGSEANDLAIRMARKYTGVRDVIVLDHAYHGTSTLAIEMSPYKFDGPGGFPQEPYIHKAISPDLYRGEFQYGDSAAGIQYAADVKRIADELEKKGVGVAAFICETLLGVGGQIPLPEGYLKAAYQAVRAAGGVCIADEVQVGFGRVGEAFWGFELQGVVPDIVVLGKPIGNGHPLAAVVVSKEIATAFDNGMEYFNTFGGNPVSMVTGRAVLKVINEEKLKEHARKTGELLLSALQDCMKDFEIIGDVRGHGLFIGAEFVKDRISKKPAAEYLSQVVQKMKEKGFLLSTDGPLNNVLKIKPPLVFNERNGIALVNALRSVLAEGDTTCN